MKLMYHLVFFLERSPKKLVGVEIIFRRDDYNNEIMKLHMAKDRPLPPTKPLMLSRAKFGDRKPFQKSDFSHVLSTKMH